MQTKDRIINFTGFTIPKSDLMVKGGLQLVRGVGWGRFNRKLGTMSFTVCPDHWIRVNPFSFDLLNFKMTKWPLTEITDWLRENTIGDWGYSCYQPNSNPSTITYWFFFEYEHDAVMFSLSDFNNKEF